MSHCQKAVSNPGDLVLDPFCGCSTTLVAAENAGRQWIGIDRDENAEQMVLGQLGKLAGQTPEFWRQQVIIRKCFDQHNGWPARDDLGKIPHYIENLRVLCSGCNSAKGTKTLAQLIARNKKKGVWNFGLYGRERPIDLTDPPHPNPKNKQARGVSKKQKSLRLRTDR